MITIENSTTIDRPAEDVFAFISDVRNEARWHTDVLGARLVDGDTVRVGSTFAIDMKPFMGTSEGTETVTAYEPPRRVEFQGRMGKMEPTTTLTVEPDGRGSRVTRRVEMEPPGLLRLMTPFMMGSARKQAAGFLANLKRVLESE